MSHKLILVPDHGAVCPIEKRGRDRSSAMFFEPESALSDTVSKVEHNEQFRVAMQYGGVSAHWCVDADIKEIYQIQPGREKTSGRSKNLHSPEQCDEPLMTTASGRAVGGGSELCPHDALSKADNSLPFDPSVSPETTRAVDVIAKPEMTALLHKASLTGHAIHPGTHMHHGQVIALMRYFGFEPAL